MLRTLKTIGALTASTGMQRLAFDSNTIHVKYGTVLFYFRAIKLECFTGQIKQVGLSLPPSLSSPPCIAAGSDD